MVVRQKWSVFACLLLCIFSLPCRAQSDAAKDWTQKIVDQLQAHKRFPLEACGKSGEARVAFTLDRAGKLISTNILTGTRRMLVTGGRRDPVTAHRARLARCWERSDPTTAPSYLIFKA